jgi:hypothetical protein
MIGQIIPIQSIIDDARRVAEAGHPVAACPFPEGSAHANRWQIAFYAREQELRAEVEV